ncbi:PdaC/SigV domain-containing protein [Anaeromicropila populeti]|uniref:Deacetylase PdaC domain-containing protein n=1 Tax=Anaeromicropila populeti TaxID=37658 RepID=A0A1I6IER6_9FIRM|nr:DUF4163 domain-containing protein [Anaeromicropila populeti]SFR65222.1 protein of unknown function [Anaeromicropila populeti]
MRMIYKKESDEKIRFKKKQTAMWKGIMSAMLFTMLFTGCRNTVKKDTDQQESTPPPVTETQDNQAEIQETPQTATTTVEEQSTKSPENLSYQINTAKFDQDGINIAYPQIEGWGDSAAEQEINELIKKEIWDSQVQEVLTDYEGEEIKLTINLQYQVTCSTDEILSIMYTGDFYVEGGAHPNNVFHGITIDLKNKKKLYLSDFTAIDDEMIQLLKQSKTVKNPVLDEFADDKEAAEFKDILLDEVKNINSDTVWMLIFRSEDNFYVTENSLVISIDISHAIGDYMLVEVPGNNAVMQNNRYNDRLCLNSENFILSFRTKQSGKTLSICTSKDNDYIVYRFGTKDQIDLEYPEDKEDSWNQFKYDYYHRGGGVENSGYDEDSLTFENGGYEYRVYEQYDAVEEETTLGVVVTDLSTGKETDIAGDLDTKIGYWYDLRESDKINKENS